MASSLVNESCQPLTKADPALSREQIQALLNDTPNWQYQDNNTIVCEFQFKNYYQTMAFVNAVAWIAHQQDHHPDMLVTYNRCTITYSTHSVGGLSRNDFICAAKIDQLLS